MSRDYYLKLASIYEQMQIAVKSKPVKYALLKDISISPALFQMLLSLMQQNIDITN